MVQRLTLLAGIIVVFVSSLFYARQQDTYQILSITGFALATVSYLVILFGKNAKMFWTIIVVLLAIIQQLTEPFIIDSSYRIYISQHKATLTEINDILQHKKGEIIIYKDSIVCKDDTLSDPEKMKLKEGRNKLGNYMISRFDKEVYYGMWGFLDVRLGITYLQETPDSDSRYRHLTGNWFR